MNRPNPYATEDKEKKKKNQKRRNEVKKDKGLKVKKIC